MAATTETKFCSACGKYKSYRDGMCWGFHAEVERLEREYRSADGSDADECEGCGEIGIFDEETRLCRHCHKDSERKLAAEVEERRQEFLAERHEAHLEDIGYGKVQQARAEKNWK